MGIIQEADVASLATQMCVSGAVLCIDALSAKEVRKFVRLKQLFVPPTYDP
jgi:hypothetical protein